jgi:hypothetical protein
VVSLDGAAKARIITLPIETFEPHCIHSGE